MRIFFVSLLMLMTANVNAANIFTDWLANIHPSLYTDEKNENVFPEQRDGNGRNVFVFDPIQHSWAVYNKKGRLVGSGRASGGKDYCDDIKQGCRTVEGEFTVFRKEDKDCTSKTFPIDEGGGAPMPHCMFFYKGYAIHGSSNVMNENRSHGCIRVAKKAAEWMNKNYITPGAMVVVLPYDTSASTA